MIYSEKEKLHHPPYVWNFGKLGRTFSTLGIPVLGVLDGGYDMADLANNGANFIKAIVQAG